MISKIELFNEEELVEANKDMVFLLKEIFDSLYPNRSKNISSEKNAIFKFKQFTKYFLYKDPKEITWKNICDVRYSEDNMSGLLLELVTLLLNKNLYNAEDKEVLYSKKEMFNTLSKINKKKPLSLGAIFILLFCRDDIVNFELFFSKIKETDDYESLHFIILNYKNQNLKHIILNFLSMPNKYTKCFRLYHISDYFEDSLENYKSIISSYKDFNENTFWNQINFFKMKFKDNTELLKGSIKSIIYFYKYLINNYPEHDFFKDSIKMNEKLLFSKKLSKFILEDFIFLPYNPHILVKDYKKVVFIVNGFDKFSTQLQREDYHVVNLSKIKSSFYREELFNYIVLNIHALLITKSYFIESLNLLYELKNEENYPNPNIKHISKEEMIFLKEYYDNKFKTENTKWNYISKTKSFFKWEQNTKRMSFDYKALNYLSQHRIEPINNARVITEEDLIALSNCFVSVKAVYRKSQ